MDVVRPLQNESTQGLVWRLHLAATPTSSCLLLPDPRSGEAPPCLGSSAGGPEGWTQSAGRLNPTSGDLSWGLAILRRPFSRLWNGVNDSYLTGMHR